MPETTVTCEYLGCRRPATHATINGITNEVQDWCTAHARLVGARATSSPGSGE